MADKYEYTEEDLENFMAKAVAIVHEAGELIKDGLGNVKVKSTAVTKEFNAGEGLAAEVLTETDGAVEKLIVDKLTEAFPDHKFIGEEGIGAETEGVSISHLLLTDLKFRNYDIQIAFQTDNHIEVYFFTKYCPKKSWQLIYFSVVPNNLSKENFNKKRPSLLNFKKTKTQTNEA